MTESRNSADSLNHGLSDPVAAYDLIATKYSALRAERGAYLGAVEKVIISQIAGNASSMLDIGSGDGTRALRVAKQSGLKHVVLLEPSSAMRAQISEDADIWPIRAEDIADYTRGRGSRFDVITLLWNVLGHVPHAARRDVLVQVAALLSLRGFFFIDVIHRYNIRSYGFARTVLRYLRDCIAPNTTNGDVVVRWDKLNYSCATYGHVFTNHEMLALTTNAGLALEKRVILDYQTGGLRRFPFQGNLLYVFRRSDATDAFNASATSHTSASSI
jgi:2-polyprenyl-3-methyl-5-hydroxy-6-metoxy-1,4-benzoquinol methylase